ncbi:MAG: single-stranded-DNA-specific exonuclease RecJ [Succinivibrionaceae bacterium]|nr:single-stranded-DNA-specific exonuclease RecJ [Succinivibrionaceae bacterium]
MAEMGSRVVLRPAEDRGQLDAVADPYLRRIMLARGVTSAAEMDLSLKGLLHYSALKGIGAACALIYETMVSGGRIVVVGDYDVDGATSTALAVRLLRLFGCRNVSYYVPDRVLMGYGLSPAIAEIVKNDFAADLIITVDNGITSFDGVKRAHELGIRVLVTDHHLSDEHVPEAEAIVNPNQKGCGFQSKAMAGVGVIFYVMAALRAYLSSRNWFSSRGIAAPKMSVFLDMVAVGSIADVVRFDRNNRIMIRRGIEVIRQGRGCPCFPLMLLRAQKHPYLATESDICHLIAPLLNAVGRIENMNLGIRCLLSDDRGEIENIISELFGVNARRREMEIRMRLAAEERLKRQNLEGQNSIVLYDPSYHQGIVGLVASRLKESYNRPVAVFAGSADGELKGSVRSVDGLNIRSVLEKLSVKYPDLVLRYGGHAMAAGLSVKMDRLDEFAEVFRRELAEFLAGVEPVKTVYTDGQLPLDHISVDFVRAIKALGPWGNGFEYPVFEGVFLVQNYRFLNENKHLKMDLTVYGSHYEFGAIFFNIPDGLAGFDLWHRKVRLCYRLELNNWKGNSCLQLAVEDLAVLDSD